MAKSKKMSKTDASRIQKATTKAVANSVTKESFAARAQRAAQKNSKLNS